MKKKLQVALQGQNGRMGEEISKLLKSHGQAQKVEGKIYDLNPKKINVLIDFSSPKGMYEALEWCIENKIPFLSGTTGLLPKDEARLKSASKKIPVLWSPNMSFGVNLFLKIIQTLGKNLNQFDLQIEEAHHIKKKDSPSGTAKILQNEVERVAGINLPKILVSRGGGIIGVHKLHLMAEEEVLTIEHTALNRAVFARGAIAAAIWLQNKPAGAYTMQDVLGE